MSCLVFVYGTLQRGERYHDVIGASLFLGSHRLSPAYTLYDLGEYPGAVHGGTTPLQGEVFRVERRVMHALDELEEVPTLYRRTPVATPFGLAIVYLLVEAPTGVPVIDSGDWRAHCRAQKRYRPSVDS